MAKISYFHLELNAGAHEQILRPIGRIKRLNSERNPAEDCFNTSLKKKGTNSRN